MATSLTINGRQIDAVPGQSLFDAATQAGVRVPTSCVKQGKCRECIVEVTAGMSLLSAPTDRERHLTGNFRLSCQCAIASGGGEIHCQTMRRGQMRIERHALNLPTRHAPVRCITCTVPWRRSPRCARPISPLCCNARYRW